MTTPESIPPSDDQPQSPAALHPTARAGWLWAILPHVLTALVTLALAVMVIARWPQPGPAVSFPPTSTPAEPTTLPATTPGPSPVALAEGVARQEVADLKAEDDRLWATVYLLKAASQIADAEGSLRGNDMSTVDQALIAADYSLSLAYERAEDAQKSPIDQFRRNLDRIRSDLYLYPERMDARLAQLRQLLLTLVDEPR
ncbi:MAG: hypothetical protein H7Z42_04435 [Roseiflexaceae bacterium]|nr:hypothetical protein [Roseiflexaceae bacterium]